MPFFFRFTIFYFLFGACFVLLVRDAPLAMLADLLVSIPSMAALAFEHVWLCALLAVAIVIWVPRSEMTARLPNAVLALFCCALFFLMFTMVKTSLPYAVPFWADPMMADLDRALHGGHDPWRLTHAVMPAIDPVWFERIYMYAWVLPSLYLPVVIVLFDGDTARVRRTLILYAWAWAGIGSIFAAAFMSAGPIYFDRLLGGDTFAPLLDALRSSGIAASDVGRMQEHLWHLRQAGGQSAGSGISAFPSVHLAVATVIAIYVVERARWSLIPMIGLVATYQVLSVHLGWHYAVDGYFSILTVLALHAVLRRPERHPGLRPERV